MSEHVYRDLTPDFTDVPCETWQGADPKAAVRKLIELAGLTSDDDLSQVSLLTLARLARPAPIEPCTASRLQELAPELLKELQRTAENPSSYE